MAYMRFWKPCISLTLALVLLFVPGMQVSAESLPELDGHEETEATQETEVKEESEATETTEVTEATEVTEETEATEATETTEATEETEATEATEATETTEATEETESTEETEPAEETEATEATEATEEAVMWSLPAPISIAEALAITDVEATILLEGTVVFAAGTQAVLQDATDGIRMAFASPPDLVPGDVLLVVGHRSSSGLAVEEFEKTGTDVLPVQEATLAEGRNAVRILVKGVVLGYRILSQNGYSCQLEGTVPEGIEIGDRVDVQGVLLDGAFHMDTMVMSEIQVPESDLDSDWNFYFGQLHAHTDISDGQGNVTEAFAYAKQVENLDFFAVTDHSDSFDNAGQGAVDADGTAISQEWAAGKAAAKAVTDETFVGIFGYEMTWPEDLAIGHINTFGTPGWQTRDQEGMNTLKGYLEALAAAPEGVSQFNHPGTVYGDFRSFSEYSPQLDARVHLLEVGGESTFRAYNAFTTALDAGWHLAPSISENNHRGNWGNESQVRTVVLAEELTEEEIYDAIRNYRVYATEDADLKIEYCLNDRIMGSTIAEPSSLRADILVQDGSGDPVGLLEIVTDGGEVAASTTVTASGAECSLEIEDPGSYYYLRIRRNDVITAVTAPVWVDKYEDLGISDFAADGEKPVQGTETTTVLTLYNHENLPFVLEKVTFAAGTQEIQALYHPGSVQPLGKMEIPLTYTQDTPGAVTITATVEGSVGDLSRRYQKSLTLHFQAAAAEMLSVDAVREGMLGQAYRIRGYVTAGTANRHNTFPDSIYLQDDSGGIEVRDFTRKGVQLGTPMEVEGILRSDGGNLVLAMTDYEILDGNYYRHVPRTMTHAVAMDYDAHGGELLQIEGHVVSMTKTLDKAGVSRFTIRDIVGDLATVVVEDSIGSGAYGTNELAKEVKATRTVRAMGLLHIDEYGETVLRVRNCDEVAYVPPKRDPTNPRTGDWLHRR